MLVKQSDAEYDVLVRGLVALFIRPETPNYVRRAAINEVDHLKMVGDHEELERRIYVVDALTDAFHKISPVNRETKPFANLILASIPDYLKQVINTASLKEPIGQFLIDLNAYQKTTLSAEGGSVVITPTTLNGVPTYLYNGLKDKVQTEEVIHPVLEILNNPK